MDAPDDWSPLAVDIVTPHHSDYYSGKTDESGRRVPAADYDDPVPTQRLSIRPGTRFKIVVEFATAPSTLSSHG